ncbi:Glutathione S-transferase F5, Phi class [Zostera marina]|uniref:glutathione transferase n=1 Tax=Zostera marina TaxID=29655 RepID=A0A0K9PEE3_ZOSMR|nr:Glutathione S-transferase F5, Phi class [Zostera marina]
MAVMKIFGTPLSVNVARVIAVMNEKNLEYELVDVNLHNGDHKKEPFLSMNPFGQVPAFQDDDIKLFESRAICNYIVFKYKTEGTDLTHLADLKEGSIVGVWCEVEAHQFNPLVSGIMYEYIFTKFLGGETNESKIEEYCAKLTTVLDVYEERLKTCKYLAGDKFSMADLHHCPYLELFMKTPKAEMVTSRPHVLAWWQDISSRPAWVKASSGMQIPSA